MPELNSTIPDLNEKLSTWHSVVLRVQPNRALDGQIDFYSTREDLSAKLSELHIGDFYLLWPNEGVPEYQVWVETSGQAQRVQLLMAPERWIIEPQTDIGDAIQVFKSQLPGWWYTIGECHLSCDASCGPDQTGPDADLLQYKQFDEGFHADVRQPSTLAYALSYVMGLGLQAKASLVQAMAAQQESGEE